MKIKNLLHQPLELDFQDKVYRFQPRELKENVEEKYLDHPVLKRNKENIKVFPQPKPAKVKDKDKEQEK
jgi:hypothetical protein